LTAPTCNKSKTDHKSGHADQHAEHNMNKHISIGVIQHLFKH